MDSEIAEYENLLAQTSAPDVQALLKEKISVAETRKEKDNDHIVHFRNFCGTYADIWLESLLKETYRSPDRD